jgi:hypothetical protein
VNGTTYDFQVLAVDDGENESVGVIVSCAPVPGVSIEGGLPYLTVRDALDAALPGETVLLGPGAFYGNLVVPEGVGLRGRSAKHTVIVGDGSGTVIDVLGTGEVSDLRVENGVTGVHAVAGDVLLLRVVVHHMAGHAVAADAEARLQVVNCTLVENGSDGVWSFGETSVRNSIVTGNGRYGLSVPDGSLLEYNDVVGNTAGDYGIGTGGLGSISDPPVFADETDYLVDSFSPTVDAGDPLDEYAREPSPNGGRINMGAYGNTEWAAKGSKEPKVSKASTESSGQGGRSRCGSVGADLLLLPLLLLFFRRRRR